MKVVTYSKFRFGRYGLLSAAYLLAIVFGFLYPALVRAETTLSYSGSALSGAVIEPLAVPNISVGGTSGVVPISLSVDEGLLSLTSTSGLILNTPPSGSTIAFKGTASAVNAALSGLTYRSVTPGEKTLTATVIGANEVYNSSNGHFYEAVNHNSSIGWNDAKTTVEERTLNGAAGYLATISTESEHDFLVGKLSSDGWFGASDASAEGDWQWATGPEAGTIFWTGTAEGSVTPGNFANWAINEPNDADNNEDCAQFYRDGSGWNDIPCSGTYMDHSIVEYGAPDDMPTAPPTVSVAITINEPTINTIPITSCAELAALQTPGAVSRYDTISLSNSIDCTGQSLQPLFSSPDPDFDLLGYGGDFDGNGHTISNVSIVQVDADNTGLFAGATAAHFHDFTISGAITGHNCTGSVVGSATNTSFSNITVATTVDGWQYTGGLAGCVATTNSGNHLISQINATGSVSGGSDVVGGIVGSANFAGASTVEISNNQFNGTLSATQWAVGSIFGELRARETSSISISGTTTVAADVTPAYSAGVLAGYAVTENTGSIIVGATNASGALIASENAGGLFGEAYNNSNNLDSFTLDNVHLSIPVTATSNGRAGGLVGYSERIAIHRSSSSGAVTAEGTDAGGLVGLLYDGIITESNATGSVTSNTAAAGGLIGSFINGSISRSYAIGTVSAATDTAGGLVGYFEGSIQDSYARGAVDGNVKSGGLIANCNGTIASSYATGVVTGSDELGGLVGSIGECTTTDSFWDSETTTQSSSADSATAKTTLELKTRETVLDTVTTGLSTPWNFDSVWEMNELVNNGYPCLRWQDAGCVMPDWVDEDTDGVPSTVEDAAPNNGDGNNDGTVDSEQQNVSSLVNETTATYSVVEVDAACTFTDVAIAPEGAQPNQDGGFEYSSGLLSFTAGCGTAGYSTDVTVITYGVDVNGVVLRKYNPNTNSYFTIDSAILTAVTINGLPAVEATYTVVDGGVLDIDGVANGIIVDPVGFATITPRTKPGHNGGNGNHGNGNNGSNGNHGEGNNGNDKDKKKKEEKEDKHDDKTKRRDDKDDTSSWPLPSPTPTPAPITAPTVIAKKEPAKSKKD